MRRLLFLGLASFITASDDVLLSDVLRDASEERDGQWRGFPPVALVDVGSSACWRSFDQVEVLSRRPELTKLQECLQEVGFLTFVQRHYTKVVPLNDTTDGVGRLTSALFYLPVCGYAEGFLATAESLYYRTRYGEEVGDIADKNGFLTARDRVLPTLKSTVRRLLSQVDDGQVFLIAPHPRVLPSWKSELVRIQTLAIDSTIYGHPGQVTIPVSIRSELCPSQVPPPQNTSRPILLSAVGREKRKKGYSAIRPRVAQIFSLGQAAGAYQDVFSGMHIGSDAYDSAFFQSKFCLILPGDTLATSQSTRAMCGGCVPVFVISEPRELPFQNVIDYRQFSVRIRPSKVMQSEGMLELYSRLQSMVTSGAYEDLYEGVMKVRSYFNYSNFGPTGPYAAIIASLVRENERRSAEVW